MSPNTFRKLAEQEGWVYDELEEAVPDGWDDIARVLVVGAAKPHEDGSLLIGATYAKRGSSQGGRWVQLEFRKGRKTMVMDSESEAEWYWPGADWKWLMLRDPEDIIELLPGWGTRYLSGLMKF